VGLPASAPAENTAIPPLPRVGGPSQMDDMAMWPMVPPESLREDGRLTAGTSPDRARPCALARSPFPSARVRRWLARPNPSPAMPAGFRVRYSLLAPFFLKKKESVNRPPP